MPITIRHVLLTLYLLTVMTNVSFAQFIITEYNSDRFRIVDSTNFSTIQLVSTGTSTRPYGVAYRPSGELYVSCYMSDVVKRYSTTGTFISSFAEPSLNAPAGLAISPTGDVLVPLNINGKFDRFNSNGTFLGIVAQGNGMNRPYDVTFGPSGDLFVADSAVNSIMRFDGTTGAFVGGFTPVNTSVNFISLAFGPNGDLFTGGSDNKIHRFSGTSGADLGVFAQGGGLNLPTDLAFAPNGDLFVVSSVSGQLLHFSGATGAFLEVRCLV